MALPQRSAVLLLSSLILLRIARAGEYVSVCEESVDLSVGNFEVPTLVDDVDAKLQYKVKLQSFSADFTHQYWQLNALFQKLPVSRFTIVGVPCNQFGHQEPAKNRTELLTSLYYVRPGNKYTPHFHLIMRSDVNGENELPLYRHLKKNCRSPDSTEYRKTESFWDPVKANDISWNFEKFLIDQRGYPLFRFMPDVEPNDLVPLISDVIVNNMDNVSKHLGLIETTTAIRVATKPKH